VSGLFLFLEMGVKKMKHPRIVFSLLFLVTLALETRTPADDTVIELRFENRLFTPQNITVPANQPFKIRITNASKEAIEFESFKLNRERVVGPGETLIVLLPALRPGSYDFYDDFHQDVPQGTITAK
jgi:hypothetical protein